MRILRLACTSELVRMMHASLFDHGENRNMRSHASVESLLAHTLLLQLLGFTSKLHHTIKVTWTGMLLHVVKCSGAKYQKYMERRNPQELAAAGYTICPNGSAPTASLDDLELQVMIGISMISLPWCTNMATHPIMITSLTSICSLPSLPFLIFHIHHFKLHHVLFLSLRGPCQIRPDHTNFVGTTSNLHVSICQAHPRGWWERKHQY